MKAYITASGTCLPERVVTNEELASKLGIEPEQIFKSSGIRARRWASAGTTTSSLAAQALEQALADASMPAAEIDYLLLGTMTPDQFVPGSAPAVQNAVGLREIPCLDIGAACCNMLYGLQVAQALIVSRIARNVAICLAEVQSPYLRLTADAAHISMLFGDGAAAVIVSAEPQRDAIEIVDVFLATEGSHADDLGLRRPETKSDMQQTVKPNGDSYPHMNGQSVILHASRKTIAACQVIIERNNLSAQDVSWVVPHQANANLLFRIARDLRFSAGECNVISVLEGSGNTSSASMGIALDNLRRSGRLTSGSYVLLPAFAAGFTWGAALCRT